MTDELQVFLTWHVVVEAVMHGDHSLALRVGDVRIVPRDLILVEWVIRQDSECVIEPL